MIKKILSFTSFLLLTYASSGSLKAQDCPQSVTPTFSTTPETCASNGSLTVNVNQGNLKVNLYKADGTTFQNAYTFNTAGSHTFTTLPGATYIVEVVCNSNLGTVYTRQSVEVADNYTEISGANITVTDVCTQFTQGGTINIGSVTGGNAPYTYSIIKNNSPAYDDALSVYTSETSKQVTEFGTYQVRIKDACGAYFTSSINVTNTLPQLRLAFNARKTSCNELYLWWGAARLVGADTTIPDSQLSAGVKMVIRKDNAAGEIVYDKIYNPNDANSKNFTIPVSSTDNYHFTYTNACGISYSQVIAYAKPATSSSISVITGLQGCGTEEKMKLTIQGDNNFVYPVNVSIVDNATGSEVFTRTLNYTEKMTYDGAPSQYTVTFSDACNNVVSKTVDNPKLNAPALTLTHSLLSLCSAPNNLYPALISGTKSIYVSYQGYIPDASTAELTIVSGPSNVGIKGIKFSENRFAWGNILPGDYMVRVKTSCFERDLPLTVNDFSLLIQELSSKAESVCQGGGNITSTYKYNSNLPMTIELLDSNNNVVAENTTGNFSNLSAGTYRTRMKFTHCLGTSYFNGNEVTLTGNSETPTVDIRAVKCEPNQSFGKAYIRLTGVAPFKVRYKLETETTWQEMTVSSATDFVINNLIPEVRYNLNVEDGCGKSTPDNFIVGAMGDMVVKTTTQPCNNRPFTLSGDNVPGASYKWYNPAGVLVSSTKDYYIPNYNSSFDGIYTLEMRWDDCVLRIVEVGIYGTLCDQPITNNAISGNVFHDTNNDENVDGIGIGSINGTQLYVTIKITNEDGTDTAGLKIATLKVNSDGTYKFPSLPTGNYLIFLGEDYLDNSVNQSLPDGWKNTGENLGTIGNDSLANGILFVTVNNTNVTNANFGINKLACYKQPNTAGTALPTIVGITGFGRAAQNTADVNNWPMANKGGHIALESKTKGFVINRVSDPATTIGSNSVKGMIVYDIDKDCLSVFDGTSWKCLKQEACPDN